MTDDELMESHIKPLARRVTAIAHILQTSQPDDEIRGVLPTLIEDFHEASQDLVESFCDTSPSIPPDSPP